MSVEAFIKLYNFVLISCRYEGKKQFLGRFWAFAVVQLRSLFWDSLLHHSVIVVQVFETAWWSYLHGLNVLTFSLEDETITSSQNILTSVT